MRLYTPNHRRFPNLVDTLTPNVQKDPGIRPYIGVGVAPYLPIIRQTSKTHQDVVISTGKVVAFDRAGFVVPAGLKIDFEAVMAAGNVTAAQVLYTAVDVAAGVVNANGNAVTAGEAVVASFIYNDGTVTGATGTADRPVGTMNNDIRWAAGVAFLDMLRSPYNSLTPDGKMSDDRLTYNPAEQRDHNYAPQRQVTILCDYVCEYAMVETYDPVFGGIAVFEGIPQSVMHSDMVTYNVRSNLCMTDGSGIYPMIIGQVIRIQTVTDIGYLSRVKTRYPAGTGNAFTTLDQMPGSATGGLPDIQTFANTTAGVIHVNLTTR